MISRAAVTVADSVSQLLFCAMASSTSARAVSAALAAVGRATELREAPRSLVDLAKALPSHGVGFTVRRTTWLPNSVWTITDFRFGRVRRRMARRRDRGRGLLCRRFFSFRVFRVRA